MGEEHRSLNGADEVGGQIARLAWRGAVRAKLLFGPADVHGQKSRPRLGKTRLGAELLELLAQAAVRASKLDHAITGVERRTNETPEAFVWRSVLVGPRRE